MAEQLYWIALDHTGVANKAPLSSLDQLAQNRQADIHHGIYIGHGQLNLSVQSHYNKYQLFQKNRFNHSCFDGDHFNAALSFCITV